MPDTTTNNAISYTAEPVALPAIKIAPMFGQSPQVFRQSIAPWLEAHGIRPIEIRNVKYWNVVAVRDVFHRAATGMSLAK
jgi:hypothetical protein